MPKTADGWILEERFPDYFSSAIAKEFHTPGGVEHDQQTHGNWATGGATGDGEGRSPEFVLNQQTVAPSRGEIFNPDPLSDANGDGVADAARVGVPAMEIPDTIPRLPDLNEQEREAEENFAQRYEDDAEGMAQAYRDQMVEGSRLSMEKALQIQDASKRERAIANARLEAVTFNTDDAKLLSPDYNPDDVPKEVQLAARASVNVAVHNTANAIAKQAFIDYLDEVGPTLAPEDKIIVVTNGGVACHGEGTQVLMFDGSLKSVEEIGIGDRLMGPDSLPRTVLQRHRGTGELYSVVPMRGEPFTVNGNHVLSVITRTGHRHRGPMAVRNIEVADLVGRKSKLKNSWLYRVGVEFRHACTPLDPYFLGLWLGDGHSHLPSITTPDAEVVEFLRSFAANIPGIRIDVQSKENNKASTYHLRFDGARAGNPLARLLHELGIWKNKHIPKQYLVNSRTNRLALLAGLLDSDGHLGKSGYGFDYITKRERLAHDIAFLARSLGLGATVRQCEKTCTNTGATGTYYRLWIGGDVWTIPTRIARKQAIPQESTKRSNGKTRRSALHTGFNIEPIGNGRFYGFTLDGDGLYLLRDFTVTHNSGKTYSLTAAPEVQALADKAAAVWDAAGEANATENPWVLEEARARGFQVVFTYTDADPLDIWANPERGVIERAGKKGRMVTARLFAESYVYGAKNFAEFAKAHANDPDVRFAFFDNSKKTPEGKAAPPVQVNKMPREALDRSVRDILPKADQILHSLFTKGKVKDSIFSGGANHKRIWKRAPRRFRESLLFFDPWKEGAQASADAFQKAQIQVAVARKATRTSGRTAPRAVRRETKEFHSPGGVEHDQSTHGNWATGSSTAERIRPQWNKEHSAIDWQTTSSGGRTRVWEPMDGFKDLQPETVADEMRRDIVERGAVWDKDGKMVGSFTSESEYSVATPELIDFGDGGMSMHNHPSGLPPSPQDIATGINVREGRSMVVGILDGSPVDYEITGFDRMTKERGEASKALASKVFVEFDEEFESSRLRAEKADGRSVWGRGRSEYFVMAIAGHTAMRKIADKFGFKYEARWKGTIAPGREGTLDDAAALLKAWEEKQRAVESAEAGDGKRRRMKKIADEWRKEQGLIVE